MNTSHLESSVSHPVSASHLFIFLVIIYTYIEKKTIYQFFFKLITLSNSSAASQTHGVQNKYFQFFRWSPPHVKRTWPI